MQRSHVAPWDTQTLTPVKLTTFYSLVGGERESFFNQPNASISEVYGRLGCYHTLQPGKDPYTLPTTPALTPAGFVRWQMIQLQLNPEEHVPFLQKAVKRFDLINPADGAHFPRVLPKESLPHQPDQAIVEWVENNGDDLESEAKKEAFEELPPRPSLEVVGDFESYPIAQTNTHSKGLMQYLFRPVKRATASWSRSS